MSSLKIALLGFGTVGSGVYQTVQTHQQRLQSLLGREVEVVGVLIKNTSKKREIGENVVVSSDIEDILNIPDLDVVIEAIVGVEPGFTYVTKAIERGFHVITANKELIAHRGGTLREKAEKHQVRLEFEAAVAGGIPVISTLKHLLQVNQVQKVEAILNGTSNYILTDIRETQSSFEDSLRLAQEKGYAEADPSNDIDGWDAFYKLMVLSDLLYGKQPNWEQVIHQGIRHISLPDIIAAESIGCRIKLVATLESVGKEVQAKVEPVLLPSSHSLYSVEGVENAVIVTGDIVGNVKLEGPGAGALPTASAIIEDLVNLFHLQNKKTPVTDVSFVTGFHRDEQSWFLVGDVANNNVRVLNHWKVTVQSQSISCSIVTGKETEIRSLLHAQPNIKGYRMEENQESLTNALALASELA
ncbi:homoserine dehydrogenase [Radiobacillus kanasensis]|uniref:homoserine dehydrogenase n=1 Tax=Radiobacillus kanasensis TaxID=2844358 RepID=UPI001E3BE0DF|nr:homoserine dehydrogenase [Radiobacillus kanasensis]UFT98475.1 homoserine dehydrogenase [Radiobacillus kanasensis]